MGTKAKIVDKKKDVKYLTIDELVFEMIPVKKLNKGHVGYLLEPVKEIA